MARINAKLFARLQSQLGLTSRSVYRLIDDKVRATHLPRHLAAIALASERGLNISRYATDNELATIRQAARAAVAPPVVAPAAPAAPAGRRAAPRRRQRKAEARRGNTVFVVHGRNDSARQAVFEFLRSLSLQPLEWIQAIRRTGQASPYVGLILETAFRDAAAVVVLLTPDDEARLKRAFMRRGDSPGETRLTGQARPNVLFEAGMAFGHNPNSTVIVQLGEVRSFSDIAGRHVVHLSNDPTSRQEFATKLANAGCNVDTSGAEWLTAGNFTV